MPIRVRARTDDNQTDIVRTLRHVGAYVVSMASIGGGVPDLLVGFRGKTYLLEVKDGDKPKCQQKLTPLEIFFHKEWTGGSLSIVRDKMEALRAIGAVR